MVSRGAPPYPTGRDDTRDLLNACDRCPTTVPSVVCPYQNCSIDICTQCHPQHVFCRRGWHMFRLPAAGEDGQNRYQFSEGVVTIKEVINKSFWGIFNTAGLLAEFKVVGTWEAFPIEELPQKPSSE